MCAVLWLVIMCEVVSEWNYSTLSLLHLPVDQIFIAHVVVLYIIFILSRVTLYVS